MGWALGEVLYWLTGPILATLILLTVVEVTARFFYRTGDLLDVVASSQMNDGYHFLMADEYDPVVRKNRTRPFSEPKTGRHFRIVCFGGSSTAGFPYSQDLAFPHFLHVMLKKRWPEVRFETINLGAFAQTYGFALEAAQDTRNWRPDLFIIYSGHNELYPWNLYWTWRRQTGLAGYRYRLAAWLKKNYLTYALALVARQSLFPAEEPQMDPDFNWRSHVEAGIGNYKRITSDFSDLAQSLGAGVVHATPLRNLRDYPPLPDKDYSLKAREEAEKIRDDPARSPVEAYRAARYFDMQGDMDTALILYREAADQSIEAGRVHSSILEYIEDIPTEHPSARVIDVAGVTKNKIGRPVIGDETLVDWCHLKLETNLLIAGEIMRGIEDLVAARMGPPAGSIPGYRDILRLLVDSPEEFIAEGNLAAGLSNLQGGRYKQAAAYFGLALANSDAPPGLIGLFLASKRLGDDRMMIEYSNRISSKYSPDEICDAVREFYQPYYKELGGIGMSGNGLDCDSARE